MLEALRRLTGEHVQLWRVEGSRVRPLAGEDGAWWPPLAGLAGLAGHAVEAPEGAAWLEPVRSQPGHWLQLGPDGSDCATRSGRAQAAAEVMAEFFRADREAGQVAGELATRYEEIDLLYTIAEILGRTVRLEEAAQTIAREVADVVGARRASILVHDEATHTLRMVAGRGLERYETESIRVDDPDSIAARVFRNGEMLAYDPSIAGPHPGAGPGKGYKGASFLSLPIIYQPPGGEPRPIGVFNLTDRIGADTFTAGHKKLLNAIAYQVGAAIENARLVERERRRVRLDTELVLAHELQSALMQPHRSVLAKAGDIGARTDSAESVGGDFYKIVSLRSDTVGIFVGDVSSHGLTAAMLMAHVIAAAGIVAHTSSSPELALRRLLDVIGEELARAEMHVSLFYGIHERKRGLLRYANAGHPQAFLVPTDGGPATRLAATAPPLGLGERRLIKGDRVPWPSGSGVLCLFSDGFSETADGTDQRYGEDRLLRVVRANLALPAPAIVAAAFDDVKAFAGAAAAAVDDRTLVLVRR